MCTAIHTLYSKKHGLRREGKPDRFPDISLYFAFDHLEFDGLAGLPDLLRKDRAFLDALEDLLGFLTIRGCGIAHEGNGIMHFSGHCLAFLRRADQLCS